MAVLAIYDYVGTNTHFSRISACWLRYASNCHLDLRQVGLSSPLKTLASIEKKRKYKYIVNQKNL